MENLWYREIGLKWILVVFKYSKNCGTEICKRTLSCSYSGIRSTESSVNRKVLIAKTHLKRL